MGSIPTASTIFLRSNPSLAFQRAPGRAPAAAFSASVEAVFVHVSCRRVDSASGPVGPRVPVLSLTGPGISKTSGLPRASPDVRKCRARSDLQNRDIRTRDGFGRNDWRATFTRRRAAAASFNRPSFRATLARNVGCGNHLHVPRSLVARAVPAPRRAPAASPGRGLSDSRLARAAAVSAMVRNGPRKYRMRVAGQPPHPGARLAREPSRLITGRPWFGSPPGLDWWIEGATGAVACWCPPRRGLADFIGVSRCPPWRTGLLAGAARAAAAAAPSRQVPDATGAKPWITVP